MSATPGFSAKWVERLRAGDPEVLAWYACAPRDVAERSRLRAQHQTAPLAADELAEWRAFLAPFAPHAAVGKNLARLADGSARVVVTGQQAGFLGGPLLVLWKAAAAIRLARDLQKETGAPHVPVFWVASDDHDFAEVAAHAWVDADGKARERRFGEAAGDSGRPVFARGLGNALPEFLAEFEETLPKTLHRDDIVAALRKIDGATWESQFVACLLAWFGECGLVPFAPRMEWARRRAVPLMEREIAVRGATARMLRESGERLEALGARGVVIHRAGDEANFFVDEGGVRAKVRWRGDAAELLHPVTSKLLATKGADDLLRDLRARPDAFSPNAALRPVVQDAILPTVAYVGGPAEVVYHAQAGVLYETFGAFRPAVVPRPSAVVVDPRTRRILERWGIGARDAVAGGAEFLRAMAAKLGDRDGLSDRAAERLAALRENAAALDELLAPARDTALERSATRLRRSIDKGTARIQRLVVDGLARRDAQVARELALLLDAFFPFGEPQERKIGAWAPFLVEGGMRAAAQLPDALDPFGGEVAVLYPDRG